MFGTSESSSRLIYAIIRVDNCLEKLKLQYWHLCYYAFCASADVTLFGMRVVLVDESYADLYASVDEINETKTHTQVHDLHITEDVADTRV